VLVRVERDRLEIVERHRERAVEHRRRRQRIERRERVDRELRQLGALPARRQGTERRCDRDPPRPHRSTGLRRRTSPWPPLSSEPPYSEKYIRLPVGSLSSSSIRSCRVPGFSSSTLWYRPM